MGLLTGPYQDISGPQLFFRDSSPAIHKPGSALCRQRASKRCPVHPADPAGTVESLENPPVFISPCNRSETISLQPASGRLSAPIIRDTSHRGESLTNQLLPLRRGGVWKLIQIEGNLRLSKRVADIKAGSTDTGYVNRMEEQS